MLCGGEKMEQKLRRDRDLGDNLRRLRNASGLSQEKLCAELQCRPGSNRFRGGVFRYR